ncbi:hypothetical protein BKA59DRAFT_170596 [Fusarium tricinctum]|uniref:Uncharacterized protein n=1 Tax=Fusarium tricinctum TaxID=61284 RepID=A0A8K0RX95_9HYPO|nr:hypothetical protein BKA59DRAFT_170596 [Fusarium tricinctum]
MELRHGRMMPLFLLVPICCDGKGGFTRLEYKSFLFTHHLPYSSKVAQKVSSSIFGLPSNLSRDNSVSSRPDPNTNSVISESITDLILVLRSKTVKWGDKMGNKIFRYRST